VSAELSQSFRRITRGALSAAAVAGLVGTVVAATPAPATRFVPGLAFRISASTRVYPGDTPRGQDDEVMRGRGIAANSRARVEFLAFTPAPQGVTTDDYLIALDSGKTFVQHTKDQRFTPANDMFGGPAVIALGRVLGGGRGGFGGGWACGTVGGGGGGGAARGGRGGGFPGGARGGGGGGPRGGRGARGGCASGFLNQLQLLDVKFQIEKLGAGEVMDGRQTQHYRITTDYRILWVDKSIPAHSVTEVWSTDLPTQIPNPFEPLIVADQSTDGPLIEYALKLRAIRAQIAGTLIKVVNTTTLTGIHDVVGFQQFVGNDPTMDTLTIVQQTQITGITAADVDPKLLVVPETGADSPQH
jgi:hypothetical protein